jgi:hypothetical protein
MTTARVSAVSLCALLLLLATGCAPGRDRMPRLSVTLPFGAVDPISEPQGDGTLRVTGWVLSADPVQTVSLYINGHYVTSARLYQPRPDVNQAYPAYGAVNAGWQIEFDTGLFPGEHEVVVQTRTAHGATRDLVATRMRFRGRP